MIDAMIILIILWFLFRWLFCLLIVTPVMIVLWILAVMADYHREIIKLWQKILDKVWYDM